MNRIIPSIEHSFQSRHTHASAQVINLDEEKKIEKEVQALIELHDFIKAHPDSPVKDIARFMPPIDTRVVNKAIQALAIRDQHKTKGEKDLINQKVREVTAEPKIKKWGRV